MHWELSTMDGWAPKPTTSCPSIEPYTIRRISSTIHPTNGDRNPDGVTLAPNTFDDIHTVLTPGVLLVSSINNAAITNPVLSGPWGL